MAASKHKEASRHQAHTSASDGVGTGAGTKAVAGAGTEPKSGLIAFTADTMAIAEPESEFVQFYGSDHSSVNMMEGAEKMEKMMEQLMEENRTLKQEQLEAALRGSQRLDWDKFSQASKKSKN